MLYDIVFVILGVVVDLSYILILVIIKGYVGEDLMFVLEGVDVVLVFVGVVCKLGMDCVDLFNVNVGIVKVLVEKIVVVCLKVCVGIIINLVNIMVFIVVEVLKKAGVYDKCKLFGVIILDVICFEIFVVVLKDKDLG